MTDNYRRLEIQRVLDAGPHDDEDWFRIVVSGKRSTRHLNLSPGELESIRDLLFVADNNGGSPMDPETLKVTFPSARTAGRCATDLRNRGFEVSGDLIGATLIVRTPSGWTGTPARPVIAAHGEHKIVDLPH